MNETESEIPEQLTERFLPQTSIRFLVVVIGFCALGMYTFRAAIVGDQLWAKCASLVIATVIVSFLFYFMVFLVASLFSATTEAIVELPSQLDRGESRSSPSAGQQ